MPARVSLLAGLAHCGECGAKLITGSRGDGRRVYVCPARSRGGNGCVQIAAGDSDLPPTDDDEWQPTNIDQLMAAVVVKRLDTEHLAAAMAEPEGADSTAAELERIEAELEALAADTELSHRELLARRRAFADKRDTLRAKLGNGARTAALAPYVGGGLRKAWPTLTLDQRRAIVAAVVGRVSVARATRKGPSSFDGRRVSVEWLA